VNIKSSDLELFEEAVAQMLSGAEAGGVPIGAALGRAGQLVASGRNERVQKDDPIAHAEIACLRNAGRITSYETATLYTTLSPCSMCAGAVVLFSIPRIVVGEAKTFSGELDYMVQRGVEVIVLDDARCVAAMKRFQNDHPDLWFEDIGQPLTHGAPS
jgi:creatinine deaminase